MVTPTASSIRLLSKVDFDSRGYPEAQPDDPLDPVVATAVGYVQAVTWRMIDTTLPVFFTTTAELAVRLATEQIVMQGQDDYVETVTDDAVASFTAGPYSESRTNAIDGTVPGKVLNQWPELDRLLWLLMSLAPGEENDLVDQRREFWLLLFGNVHAPAWAVIPVAWDWAWAGAEVPLFPSWPVVPAPIYGLDF